MEYPRLLKEYTEMYIPHAANEADQIIAATSSAGSAGSYAYYGKHNSIQSIGIAYNPCTDYYQPDCGNYKGERGVALKTNLRRCQLSRSHQGA